MSGLRGLIFMVAVVVAILSAWTALSRAGLDLGPARPPRRRCWCSSTPIAIYCRVFRRDVLPKYRGACAPRRCRCASSTCRRPTPRASACAARIDTVPTAVVMRDGREVDRIVGYWGPTNFFKLLSHILARVE